MIVFDILRKNIEAKVEICDQDFDDIIKYFTFKKLRKKQFFLNQGDVCSHLVFVNSGCLRSYLIDEKGQERIIQFAIEDSWISNMTSMMSGEPSLLDIDAMEDSELLIISKGNREELFQKVPKFESYFRILHQQSFIEQQKRITSAIIHSANEKYMDFIDRYPKLCNRVPQHMIASYLGISPETLSRSRKSN
jgi:CRP-like cAMP-binding protein